MSPTNWWCQIISTTHNKLLNAYIKSTLPAVIETIVVFHFFQTFQPHVIVNYNYCLWNKMGINNLLHLNFSHLPTACTVTQNTYRPVSRTFYSNQRRHADRLENIWTKTQINTVLSCFPQRRFRILVIVRFIECCPCGYYLGYTIAPHFPKFDNCSV